MIIENLQRYRYVREYDTNADIDESLIYSLLQKTWKVTPSKNNFMNYKVRVIGPEQEYLKKIVFRLSLHNEHSYDAVSEDIDSFIKERYTDKNTAPQYRNILTCSYLLVFTQRIADTLNPYQEHSISRGRSYEQLDAKNIMNGFKGSCIEAGMFASNFAALCFEHGLDISHTLCTPTRHLAWSKLGIEEKKEPAILFLMTIGKGKVYRRDTADAIELQDYKPDFDKIVQFMR